MCFKADSTLVCYTAILDLLLLHNCNYSHFVLLPLLSVSLSLCLSLKASLKGIKARELIKKLTACCNTDASWQFWNPWSHIDHWAMWIFFFVFNTQWLRQLVLNYLELVKFKYTFLLMMGGMTTQFIFWRTLCLEKFI